MSDNKVSNESIIDSFIKDHLGIDDPELAQQQKTRMLKELLN